MHVSQRPRSKPLFMTALLTLFVASAAAGARADTVVITSGSYVVSGASVTSNVNMSGNNLSISGAGTGGQGFPVACSPCQPGSVQTPNFSLTGLSLINVSTNSATYSNTNPLQSVGGTFNFAGANFVIPDTDNPEIVVPFTFTGHVHGQTTTAPLVVFFDHDIVGQGLATIRLSTVILSSGQRAQFFQSITYNFNAPEPMPEPTTIVLFGAGLAAAVRRRRRAIPRD